MVSNMLQGFVSPKNSFVRVKSLGGGKIHVMRIQLGTFSMSSERANCLLILLNILNICMNVKASELKME